MLGPDLVKSDTEISFFMQVLSLTSKGVFPGVNSVICVTTGSGSWYEDVFPFTVQNIHTSLLLLSSPVVETSFCNRLKRDILAGGLY